VPTAIAGEVRRRYHLAAVREITAIRERFFAISGERRIQNPAVTEITNGGSVDTVQLTKGIT
jgi:hypothetical protein